METSKLKNKEFYESIDRKSIYTVEIDPEKHPFYPVLIKFVKRWGLADKKCLEIGSSKGLFQDIVHDYTGVDIAASLSGYYHKEYIVVEGADLPFPDDHFDAIFSYTTHEHIVDIEKSLEEIIRTLKPGGVCLFAPAWHTRPWFADGYEVRPYSDFNLRGKGIKSTIQLRDCRLIRWPVIIMRRLFRLIGFCMHNKAMPLKYKKLRANYSVFWQADSDACNSMDPFDILLWFKSRGFICHNMRNVTGAVLTRAVALELQKMKK
jgi:SAM-dependent methyltransferase